MPKSTLVVVSALLLVTTAAGGALSADAASSNGAPLADAGLDQDVTKSATVLLDGTGSRDPDGRIERYDWSIRTPSNRTITPDCADCGRTRFTPTETGRYRVTVTVTDDDGATSADTLYVDVEPGTPPSVSVAGPERPTVGTTATYTAALSAGSAALDYVVWRVDGMVFANHSLSADQRTDTATKLFPTAGDRSVSATVHDADGQANASSLSVAVGRGTEPDGLPERPEPPGSSPGSSASTADRNSPRVTGDELVTGAKPLRGQYAVRLDASASEVASVEWRDAAGRIGGGRSLTKAWEPGDHELYAVVTYADGSDNVATFQNGETTVIADPRPTVSVDSLDRFGSISGATTATDGYENLDTLRVEVGGETVAVARPSVKEQRRLDFDRQRTLRFSHDDFEPGEEYSVTVVAVDKRGQKRTVTRDLVPAKKPEVVRSEFVNGPVDSYHERIDPSRYAAHHVLEVDLNGVDAENLNVAVQSRDELIKTIDRSKFAWNQKEKRGILRIDSFWAGKIPQEYHVYASLSHSSKQSAENWKSSQRNTFQVVPSKPELRLNVVNDGTEEYITKEHGILVDASSSFDPDGTELKYIWKYGAEPTKPDNTTAKFGAYERAASIVEDKYDLQESRNFDFLNYFVPDIAEKTIINKEPHYANETVRVQVKTEPFHFSKQTYYDKFSLGITVDNPSANVVEWKQVEAPNSGHAETTEDAYRYIGTLKIPITALSSQPPTVTIYNEENTRKEAQTKLPEASVFYKDTEYWSDVTVNDLTYVVQKPIVRRATAETRERRDEYLDEGYHVEEVNEDTKYILEKRVKVRDAKYETVTRNFQNRRVRDLFLSGASEWSAAGTVQKEETRTRTYSRWFDSSSTSVPSMWHDSSLWNGEKTGSTRSVKVEPAEYQTKRKYRYEYEVERTNTWTRRSCTLRFGCTTETYTYTYTVTKTNTYWSTGRFSYGHQFTGDTRRVKVEDAVYDTEFEVRYRAEYTELVTYYAAEHEKLVREAKYGWEGKSSTMEYYHALKQANRDGWRIEEESVSTWDLVRQDGVRQYRTPTYTNENHVIETEAVVSGEFTEQYLNAKTGEIIEKSEPRTSERSYSEAKTGEEIIESITAENKDISWCDMKTACPSANGDN